MHTVEQLEAKVSDPTPGLISDFEALPGDLLILGAGGKLGPNLAAMALRADRASGRTRTIYAASRFSDPSKAIAFENSGVVVCETDLSRDNALSALPDAENILYLIGKRFGTHDHLNQMWFMNAWLPGKVIERFPSSRVVALSTGNVYPMCKPYGAWPDEEAEVGPVGEYAMSCLGRERIMSQRAAELGTDLSLVRLNYSVEMRYGPIVDLTRQIMSRKPVDLSMGYLNLVWQGYSNNVILRSFQTASPKPNILNVTGPELASVRQIAATIGQRLNIDVAFENSEAETALLSDASRCHRIYGKPDLDLGQLLELTVNWMAHGLPTFGTATGFQSRSGKF